MNGLGAETGRTRIRSNMVAVSWEGWHEASIDESMMDAMLVDYNLTCSVGQ